MTEFQTNGLDVQAVILNEFQSKPIVVHYSLVLGLSSFFLALQCDFIINVDVWGNLKGSYDIFAVEIEWLRNTLEDFLYVKLLVIGGGC